LDIGDFAIKGDEQHFLNLARLQLTNSIDGRRGVGAVIAHPVQGVTASGANRLPDGIGDLHGLRTPPGSIEKEYWTEHAERVAIYSAARDGIPLRDCTIYVTLFPCHHCARAIILSGLTRVVCPVLPDFQHKKFGDSWKRSVQLLLEARVAVYIPGSMVGAEDHGLIRRRVMEEVLFTFSKRDSYLE
jgi:dCMP deaminase